MWLFFRTEFQVAAKQGKKKKKKKWSCTNVSLCEHRVSGFEVNIDDNIINLSLKKISSRKRNILTTTHRFQL